MRISVQKAFEDIRRIYFPLWDGKRLWRVKQVNDLHGLRGQCDEAKRIILIRNDVAESDDRDCVLIHEIAHAVCGGWHGQRWKKRYKQAAIKAQKCGLSTLAQKIEADIQRMEQGFRPTPNCAYRLLENIVCDDPSIEFRVAAGLIGEQLGMDTETFLRRFKRAKAIFDEARQLEEEVRQIRAAWGET